MYKGIKMDLLWIVIKMEIQCSIINIYFAI